MAARNPYVCPGVTDWPDRRSRGTLVHGFGSLKRTVPHPNRHCEAQSAQVPDPLRQAHDFEE
jgi:hypothetical protein